VAIKFEKIHPGMVLWSRGKSRQGRTTLVRFSEWRVVVNEVDSAGRRALVSWNGNAPEWWSEYRLTRLFRAKKQKAGPGVGVQEMED